MLTVPLPCFLLLLRLRTSGLAGLSSALGYVILSLWLFSEHNIIMTIIALQECRCYLHRDQAIVGSCRYVNASPNNNHAWVRLLGKIRGVILGIPSSLHSCVSASAIVLHPSRMGDLSGRIHVAVMETTRKSST